MIKQVIKIGAEFNKESFVDCKTIRTIVGDELYYKIAHKEVDRYGNFTGCTIKQVAAHCSAAGHRVEWN